jgi:hypothetical protein
MATRSHIVTIKDKEYPIEIEGRSFRQADARLNSFKAFLRKIGLMAEFKHVSRSLW